ncbi:MAG: hypothetical protein OHK0013_24400 [Sandaracinaceae bacterium]
MPDHDDKPALPASGSSANASSDPPSTGAPPPSEELRKAVEHLGRAASSFRDRYLSDEKLHAATERARVEAEHLTEDAERALRRAGSALDELAVDAEKSIAQVAQEAEKTLRKAQRSAAPVLKLGIARLTEILGGKSVSTASSAEDPEPATQPTDRRDDEREGEGS